MAPTPSPTSKTTGLKGQPNKNSNVDFDIDGLVKEQSFKKRLLVRRPSIKSVSTRSSTSSIRSTESNTSQSSRLNAGKKKPFKRHKKNVLNETEKQSPVHIEQKIMGQNQSQAETKTEEKSDGKNHLETLDTVTTIIDSSSDDKIATANISDEKLKKSQVVLTRIDESSDFSDSDMMKPKRLKRKTPEDGFGDNMVMPKRSKMARQAKKNSPERTKMVSNSSAKLSIAHSVSLSDDVDTDECDAFANAMKDLDNDEYGLGPEVSLFANLETFDPLALTTEELAGYSVSEYQNGPAENPTQNVETIEHVYQGTSNMKSSSAVAQPTNGNCDESDSEDDEMHIGDVHESDGEAVKQNGEGQNEVENSNCSEDGESDDDAISIFGHDDLFLEADFTENTQSKRQMQLPRWKNLTKKTNEVPKLIPGTALTKGTPVPRLFSRPSTLTASIKIKDFANDSTGTITRQITNDLPLTPSSRDPREQKRLMLAEKQNAIQNGQSSVDSHMSQPSTSNSMQPPTAPPLRKPVKERLGLRDKKIPSLMSVNPFATMLQNPGETYLPRDEPQGEILPELETDNKPQAPQIPKLPPIPRVNIKESLIVPTFFQSQEQYRPVFGYLFEKVCRPFINDDCAMNPNQCQFNHRLPDVESFGISIDKLLVDDVVQTYKEFMMRIPKLFETYFHCLASYFAKKQRRDVLKRMIIDCNAKFKQQFFPHIVKCFMQMGDSYTKALAELIQTIKNRTAKTSHEIVKLILDGRNTNIKPFFKVLHRISEQKNYTFSVDHVNRLLRLFDNTKNIELAAAIFNITSDTNLAKRLDQEYLKKFVDLHKVTKLPTYDKK